MNTIKSWVQSHALTFRDLRDWGVSIQLEPEKQLRIPIRNLSGETIWTLVRHFDGTWRYEITPEGIHRGYFLYGLDRTIQRVSQSGEVVVVEGFSDVLALYTHGARNVCAMLGSYLSRVQLGTLAAVADHIIVWFDGDESGENAARKLAAQAQDIHLTCFTIDGFDPAEWCVAHDPSRVIARVEEAAKRQTYVRFDTSLQQVSGVLRSEDDNFEEF